MIERLRVAAVVIVVLVGASFLPFYPHGARVLAPIVITPFDEYGNICWEDEKARLDNFSIQLNNDPKLVGYIVVYAGRISCPAEAKYRGNRARDWTIKRGVNPKRVIFKDGGFRPDVQTVLRLQPIDAPNFDSQPTLKKDEVSVRKRCVDKVFQKILCLQR